MNNKKLADLRDKEADKYRNEINRCLFADDDFKSGFSKAVELLQPAIDALKYIQNSVERPDISSIDLMSELANERLFDISEARKALKEIGEISE